MNVQCSTTRLYGTGQSYVEQTLQIAASARYSYCSVFQCAQACLRYLQNKVLGLDARHHFKPVQRNSARIGADHTDNLDTRDRPTMPDLLASIQEWNLIVLTRYSNDRIRVAGPMYTSDNSKLGSGLFRYESSFSKKLLLL